MKPHDMKLLVLPAGREVNPFGQPANKYRLLSAEETPQGQSECAKYEDELV